MCKFSAEEKLRVARAIIIGVAVIIGAIIWKLTK